MGVSSVKHECINLLKRAVLPGDVDMTAQPLLAWGQTLLPGLVALKGMDETLETINSKAFSFCNRESAR